MLTGWRWDAESGGWVAGVVGIFVPLLGFAMRANVQPNAPALRVALHFLRVESNRSLPICATS
jgi:hypothetical protein